MIEAIIYLLIQVCVVVGICWLVIWVLGQLGVALPEKVIQIFWVIVILVVILLLYQTLAPMLHLRI